MRNVAFTPLAIRQFRRLPKASRSVILEGIRKQPVDADPAELTRNKFRLRHPSAHADFELRIGCWRVFYRVLAHEVVVTLVGKKEGNRLLIDSEEFLL
jgi:mRNA-degrading endonuclease RelE of RelBE toxin-antitoxin system